MRVKQLDAQWFTLNDRNPAFRVIQDVASYGTGPGPAARSDSGCS